MSFYRINRISRLTASLFVAGLLFVSCDQILSVDNPTALTEDDLQNPEIASNTVNGALGTLMSKEGISMSQMAQVTDETNWVGSFDSYRNNNLGLLERENQYINNAWNSTGEARWMADRALQQMQDFDDQGVLDDPVQLGRAHLFAGLVRVLIAERWDDFVFSDRTEAAPPLGEEEMRGLFDDAVNHFDEAINIAESAGANELRQRAFALRVRAMHSQRVREIIKQGESPASDPFVTSQEVQDAAEEAIQEISNDFSWIYDYNSANMTNTLHFNVMSRQEFAFTDFPDDPVTEETDTRLLAFQNRYEDSQSFGDTRAPQRVISARMVYLIAAESYMGEDDDMVRTHLNTIREDIDGLPPITEDHDLQDALLHERYANLYFQGLRLHDMYRFGDESEFWIDRSHTLQNPGRLLPIPSGEINANPHLD